MDFDPGVAPHGIEWYRERGDEPKILSISDIHGYRSAARSALAAVGETAEFPPVVRADGDGRLHWAGNDYLLLVNGDLIDRGEENRACLELLERLAAEAPPGRVRYHLGNHEMAVLFPERFRWPGVFSIEMAEDRRRSFVERVANGDLRVAFEGYQYTYSHAGANEAVDVRRANEQARDAAKRLVELFREGRYREGQLDVLPEYDLVFGLGGQFGRGESAGLLWMDFEHMKPSAPPQIVGHSRQTTPTRKGAVICENVIRNNLNAPGGEAVLIETPDGLRAVRNTPDGAAVTEL
ncbi:MAG: metallophosphoesterase [Halodesulfurarchaeum sp.]